MPRQSVTLLLPLRMALSRFEVRCAMRDARVERRASSIDWFLSRKGEEVGTDVVVVVAND